MIIKNLVRANKAKYIRASTSNKTHKISTWASKSFKGANKTLIRLRRCYWFSKKWTYWKATKLTTRTFSNWSSYWRLQCAFTASMSWSRERSLIKFLRRRTLRRLLLEIHTRYQLSKMERTKSASLRWIWMISSVKDLSALSTKGPMGNPRPKWPRKSLKLINITSVLFWEKWTSW